MVQQATHIQPGWYQAQTDPPGLLRWWDGTNWQQYTQANQFATQPSRNQHVPFAEVEKRIAASIIDFVILYFVYLVVQAFTFDQLRFFSYFLTPGQSAFPSEFFIYMAATVGGTLLYFFLMNSLFSATIGKLILGIKIVQHNGDGLGFTKGFLRTSNKFIHTGGMLLIIYMQSRIFRNFTLFPIDGDPNSIDIALENNLSTFGDMAKLMPIMFLVQGSLVVLALVSFIQLFDNDRRTVMDRLAKTFVINSKHVQSLRDHASTDMQ